MTIKFEIGKTYTTRSIGDYDCIYSFTVIKRTEKFVTVENRFGEVVRRKVKMVDDVEWFIDGNYSMAPIFRADKFITEEREEVIAPVVEEQPKPELKQGETVDESKTYITIIWAEGIQVYKKNARFGSFASAHQAILEIYNANLADTLAYGGYTKVKFAIHYPDGEVYEGRLDLCPKEDNPTTCDNILKTHCLEYMDYCVEHGYRNREEVVSWLAKYSFDDEAPQAEILKLRREVLEVSNKIAEYLELSLEILETFPGEQAEVRLKSLDEEYGADFLKRRAEKLKQKLKAHLTA
jgi:hypothetical protein